MKILLPWNNLNCIGIKFKDGRYGDIFRKPYFGLYWNDCESQRWFKLPSFRLLKQDAIDLESMRMELRKWQIPYAPVLLMQFGTLQEYECISYPWIGEHGGLRINVRRVNQPETMIEVNAMRLRKRPTGWLSSILAITFIAIALWLCTVVLWTAEPGVR